MLPGSTGRFSISICIIAVVFYELYQSYDRVPDSEPIDYVLATAAVKQLLRDNVATNITIPRWMGHKVILLFNCKIEFPNSWF